MATSINIDFDGFGFLDDSDDCAAGDVSKMLKKQQPPISPIESESSSSGISSLDSDDLKKQLLSSPPTISISHDEEEEEEEEEVDADRESNSGSGAEEEKEQTDSGADGDDEELDSCSSESVNDGEDENEEEDEKDDDKTENDDKEDEQMQPRCKSVDELLDYQEKMNDDEAARSKSSPVSPTPLSTSSVAAAAINQSSVSTPNVTITPAPQQPARPAPPMRIIYENRDILDLSANIGASQRYEFVQHTVLPENNISCFFQNRAQYWRLGNGDEKEVPDTMMKCSSCDFTFPSINNNLLSQQGQASGMNKNSITDSLLTFLKNHHADYNTFNNAMPNSININNHNNNNSNNTIASAGHNSAMFNPNGHNAKPRMYNNNNNAPYVAYQMIQQQQQFPTNTGNGYYASGMNNGWNNPPPAPPMPNQQQHIHQQQQHMYGNGGANVNGNNNSGYNGTALAILNLMNPPQRNLANAGAFQPMNNNTSRYYNTMNTTNNNGFGLYKQF